MDNTLSKIVKISVSKQVVQVIEEKIFAKEWKVGTKIPSENELCEALDVSRVSVRSAVQELVGLGLLESRQGEGTYVKDFSLQEYFSRVSPLVFNDSNLKETAEYRFAIESSCAKFAIDHYDLDAIDELERLCNESEALYHTGSFNDYISADYLFHRHLCIMAKNDILLMMFDAFSLSFFKTSEKNLRIVATPNSKRDLSHHLDLVQAIRNKDFSEAYRLCYHLILYKDK